MTWNTIPHTTPRRTAVTMLMLPAASLPTSLIIEPKNRPIHSPEPAPEATARPQLMRPVIRSTCRRSVPMMVRHCTGKPSSDRESTACWASA